MKKFFIVLLFPVLSFSAETITCEVDGLFSNETATLEFIVDGVDSRLTQTDETRSMSIPCFENKTMIDQIDPQYKEDFQDATFLTCDDNGDTSDFVFYAGKAPNVFHAMLLDQVGKYYFSFKNCDS